MQDPASESKNYKKTRRWRTATKKQAERPSQSMKIRANGLILSVTLVMAALLILNIFKISVLDHDYYSDWANSRQFGTIAIPAKRGSIYDANGTILAQSATVYRIYVDPGLFRNELASIEEKNKKLLESAEKKSDQGTPVSADIIDTNALKQQLAVFLAEQLDISLQKVQEAFEAKSNYVVLKKQVEKNTADRILEYVNSVPIVNSERKPSFASITRESDTKRYYPQNELAAAVIGFNNSDGDGVYGIEAYYNDYLSGIDGKTITAKDASGNEMPYRYSKTYDAQDGDDVYLTIDMTLQTYVENALTEMVETFSVENRGCGIMLNAKTGAVLAMASVGGFDLNAPYEIYDEKALEKIRAIEDEEERANALAEQRETQWKNKCVSETYIPGSVFKVYTASAGLEENAITYENTFNCTGSVEVADTTINCWKKKPGHGSQSFEQILTNSCNPAFISIGQALGKDLFCQYFEAFGLTERTGIDLPGETSSVYCPLSRMGEVELASSSFGQTNSLSPIEMITGYAAVVNGGQLLKPYVVSKIVDGDGNVVLSNEKSVRRQVISEETSAEMRKALQAVVENNGGSNAYIKGYKIGGKSGTAQKLMGGYTAEDMKFIASYCCFAPADDPEIVLLIVADEPYGFDERYYGSTVAVPYARAVMEKALPYLGYYADDSGENAEKQDIKIPMLIDETIETAGNQLTELGLKFEIVGEGDIVNMQTPITGSKVSKGSTVLLYTGTGIVEETVTVPLVTGMTAEEANAKLTEIGLNYIAKGASTDRKDVKVLLQSIPGGTQVSKWSVIELDFGSTDQSG